MRKGGALMRGTIVTAILLFAASEAHAQYVTASGVECPGGEVSFDALDAPTTGADTARRAFLSRLYAIAADALDACAVETALPGCAGVLAWESERTSLKYPNRDGFGERAGLLAHDGPFLLEARRALAHKACKGLAEKYSSNSACSALVQAEEHAGHFSIKIADKDRDDAIKKVSSAPAKSGIPSAPSLLPTPLEEDNKKLTEFKSRIARARQTCAGATASCDRTSRDAVEFDRATTDLAQVQKFYSDYANQAVSQSDADIINRVNEVPLRMPASRAVVMPKPDEHSEGAKRAWTALASEVDAIKGRRDECAHAEYYVGPSGALYHQFRRDEKEPYYLSTICVDSSSFAVDRPLQVAVTQYPGGMNKAVSSSSWPIELWPGEPAPLVVKGPAVVRITVRAYPRGNSLREFAQRGAAPLDSKQESIDLLNDARRVRVDNERAQLDEGDARTLSLLADALEADTRFKAAIRTLEGAIDDVVVEKKETIDAATKAFQDPLGGALSVTVSLVDEFVTGAGARGSSLRTSSLETIRTRLPRPSNRTGDDQIHALKAAITALATYPGAIRDIAKGLRDGAQPARDREAVHARTIARICRISGELVPVVDEDVIVNENDPTAYIIDYDFQGGFQRATHAQLLDSRRVFVRVRHVAPGGSVSLQLDNKGIVEHAVSLIGFTGNSTVANPPPPSKTTPQLTTSTPVAIRDGDPDRQTAQASSTQVLALGRLDGSTRFDLTVCGRIGEDASCSEGPDSDPKTPSPSSRVIARNTILVHSIHYLGVRAGFGVTFAGGSVRELATEASTSRQVVRERDVTTGFAFPVLLAVYPGGRDTLDVPHGLSNGLIAGLDVLKVGDTPRLYAGFVEDFFGFGATVGLIGERIESLDTAKGQYVPQGSSPSGRKEWHAGAFVALTTDFDIFQTVFKDYFSPTKYPTVGGKP